MQCNASTVHAFLIECGDLPRRHLMRSSELPDEIREVGVHRFVLFPFFEPFPQSGISDFS